MSILKDKVVVVFAGAGAVGSGFARAAASHGAKVVVTARTKEPAAELARSLGGDARAIAVDALDPLQVERALDGALADFGRLDAVFNAIGGRPSELGYPQRSVATSLEDFALPFERIVKSQFLIARCAAVRMMERGGGAIVLLSATLSGMTAKHMAGITAACGAVESLTRALAGDFGGGRVRVNCVRGSAMPETRTIQETFAGTSALGDAPQMVPSPLGRPITVEDTARAAVFLASDEASGITGQILTVCAGQFV
jgi:3-oxoacyl-[acyl-carrier protein] reductase